MFATTTILTADPSLGRVDYDSLSDQTLMEMLIDAFDEETRQRYKDDDGMYRDVCQWEYVKCDGSDRVIEVSPNMGVKGSLQIALIPPKVQEFRMRWNQLSGSIDLAHLPQSMVMICLPCNHLAGSIDLSQFPESMRAVYLNTNRFTGSVDLTHLPGGLQELHIGNNQLSDSVCLTALPVDMVAITMQNNRFSGSFVATGLPPRLETLIARGNNFRCTGVVDAQTNATIDLRGSGVTAVVDEHGSEALEGIRL